MFEHVGGGVLYSQVQVWTYPGGPEWGPVGEGVGWAGALEWGWGLYRGTGTPPVDKHTQLKTLRFRNFFGG